MPPPDPPLQIRQRLAVARRQGFTFEEAWEAAVNGWGGNRIKWPHATVERREWNAVMEETRWAWEAAFYGESFEGADVLAALADALRQIEDEDRPSRPATPPIKFTELQHRRAA